MSFVMLGNQRSGTSYLLDLITEHPMVDAINEPFSMHLEYFRDNEEIWTANDYDSNFLHKNLIKLPETIQFIKELEQWLNFDFPKIRGFKETALFEKYGWMEKALTFDCVIIAMRDLRAVIQSVMRRNMHWAKWNYREILETYYHYSGPFDDHIICAELLRRRTDHLIHIIESVPCHVVKLEVLLENFDPELEKLMNFIGLEVSAEQKIFYEVTSQETRDSAYSNFRRKEDVIDRWKNFFNKEAIRDINAILKDQLEYFGYAL